MLRYFFEKTEGNIYRPLFNGMDIEKRNDFKKYQSSYPISDAHPVFTANELNTANRRIFENILNLTADETQLKNALSLLVELLTTHCSSPVIVLFDEYDSHIL